MNFWYYNKGEVRGLILCAIEECNGDGNNCKWDYIEDPRTSMVIDGDWSLLEIPFQVKDATSKISVIIQPKEASEQDIYIDEFMLREKSSEVFANRYSGKKAYLFYNNYWIQQPN